jgi:hypothetical protein
MPRSWAGSIRVTHPCATLGTLLLTSLPSGLHVLGLPLAFILSQDQTLHSIIFDPTCLAACSILMFVLVLFLRPKAPVPIRQSILTCGARCPIPLSISMNVTASGYRYPSAMCGLLNPAPLCPFWPSTKPHSAKRECKGSNPNPFCKPTNKVSKQQHSLH